jgi:hypothetical protein
MAFDPNKFINPGQFGSWENYAGFKDTDQMKSLKEIMAGQASAGGEGVPPPPQTMSDFAQQAIAPVQNTYQNFSNAATQLGQGNPMNAYNAAQGRYPAPTAPTLPTVKPPSSVTEHGYDANW